MDLTSKKKDFVEIKISKSELRILRGSLLEMGGPPSLNKLGASVDYVRKLFSKFDQILKNVFSEQNPLENTKNENNHSSIDEIKDNGSKNEILIEIPITDLHILRNVLDETLNYLDDWGEFFARIGVEIEIGEEMLEQLNQFLKIK